jgi:hypothetical protein
MDAAPDADRRPQRRRTHGPVGKEERAVRKTADQEVAPVLPYEPVSPHAGIIPKILKILRLYQQYCINNLRPF